MPIGSNSGGSDSDRAGSAWMEPDPEHLFEQFQKPAGPRPIPARSGPDPTDFELIRVRFTYPKVRFTYPKGEVYIPKGEVYIPKG